MIKIDAKRDEKQTGEKGTFVRCPICGQILTDIKILSGSILLRTVCRRCRNFISVKIKEEE
jgi:phage FluMu protein Com